MPEVWSIPREFRRGYTTKNGRWELLEKVGNGSFGVCFRARDLAGRYPDVAIKISKTCASASPERTIWNYTMAKDEASFVKKCLRIDAFVPEYYASFKELGSRFLVTQLLDVDMAAHRGGDWFSPTFVAELAHDLSQSLYGLHSELEYCHHDIKPENILIIKNGYNNGGPVGFLTDFGLAEPIKDCHPAGSGSGVAGTVLYLAPECWLNGTQEAPADIWAMGLSLLFRTRECQLSAYYRGSGTNRQIAAKILSLQEGWLEFTEAETEANPMLCSFLTGCLMRDPRLRMTAGDCVSHPWLEKIRQSRQRFHFSRTSRFLEPLSHHERGGAAGAGPSTHKVIRKQKIAAKRCPQPGQSNEGIYQNGPKVKQQPVSRTGGGGAGTGAPGPVPYRPLLAKNVQLLAPVETHIIRVQKPDFKNAQLLAPVETHIIRVQKPDFKNVPLLAPVETHIIRVQKPDFKKIKLAKAEALAAANEAKRF